MHKQRNQHYIWRQYHCEYGFLYNKKNLASLRRLVPKTLTKVLSIPSRGNWTKPYFCVCFSRKLYLGAFHAPLPYRSDPLMLLKVWLEQICAKHSPTKIPKPTRQKIIIIFSIIFVSWYDHDGRTGLALDISLPWELFPEGLNVKLWDGTKSIHVRFESASSKDHRILVSFG